MTFNYQPLGIPKKKEWAGLGPENKIMYLIKIFAFLYHPIYDTKRKEWSGLGPETPGLKSGPTPALYLTKA